MAKARKNNKPDRTKPATRVRGNGNTIAGSYKQACGLAEDGKNEQARQLYLEVAKKVRDKRTKALIRNDLAALAAMNGDHQAACLGFREALVIDDQCSAARTNLALVEAETAFRPAEAVPVDGMVHKAPPKPSDPIRLAILSFLFNWPSTGGGIVHTVELVDFLERAGYCVQHFYAKFDPWQVGCVDGQLPFPSKALEFDDATWNVADIQARFRSDVDQFAPDYVLITDSWNMKPLLAEAVRSHPYILRFQAMECLCPLNGVRLLTEPEGGFRQCPLHQLANPDECRRCVASRGHMSGQLHQAERNLSRVQTPQYHARLLEAIKGAEAVLVVNPLHEAMLSPYSRMVRVVTSGMDPARFPWPWAEEPATGTSNGHQTILFAGLVDEWMKGFRVLHDACQALWQHRQDFELVATAEPFGKVDPFTRFIGWQSQRDLPRQLRAAAMLVMPTIAQEALGRTAVEAMAVGRPVIASRLGGLPFTVLDGATGLLFEPGDAQDLAKKIEILLNDGSLRERLGLAGRRRFEENYSWDVIIEKHYKPLLKTRQGTVVR